MTQTISKEPAEVGDTEVTVEGSGLPTRGGGGLRKAVAGGWKMLVAMVCCQGVVASVLLLGWTYRLMRRSAVVSWWKQSPRRHPEVDFRAFAAGEDALREQVEWPNWFVAQRAERRSASPGFWRRWLGSSWMNVKIGAQGIFNTWVLTLPACVLWMFAWYAGWDNSFNKGYEQAWVGPVTGLLGVAMFIGAMFYLPLAQARQAVTGEFKAFYHVRRVRGVIRRRWFSTLLLAAGYAVLSLPVAFLWLTPYFMGNNNHPIFDAPPAEQLRFLEGYYFWSALVVVPAFVALRVAAARIYASAVLGLVKRGDWGIEDLSGRERSYLKALDLASRGEPVQRSVPARIVLWTGSRAGRITAGAVTAAIWFAFVAQIFIVQFFNYHPGKGWLNQPLVQLPWFHHVPAALRDAAGGEK